MILKVRKAELQDSNAICEISCAAMGYDCAAELVWNRLCSMDVNRETAYVAELDGTVVGFIHAETYKLLYCEAMVNVLGIAVASQYRRHGVGKALLNQVETGRNQWESTR